MRQATTTNKTSARARVISVLVIVALTGTFVLVWRVVAPQSYEAGSIVAAPEVLPPPIVALVRPEHGTNAFAVDPTTHRVVALAQAHEDTCPSWGPCPGLDPRADALLLYDSLTGQQVARIPLDPSAADARQVLMDTTHHIANVVANTSVWRFSLPTGQPVGHWAMPADLPIDASPGNMASDDARQMLLLATISGNQLIEIDAVTGRPQARVTLPDYPAGGPLVDAQHGAVYVSTHGPQSSSTFHLVAFHLGDLAPFWQVATPGNRLALSSDGTKLLVFGDRVGGQLALGEGVPTLTEDASLNNASAYGSTGMVSVMQQGDGYTITNSAGATVAEVPSAGWWPSAGALPTDAASNMMWLPIGRGEILFARATPATKVDSYGAVFLALDAMRVYLQANNPRQFVSVEDFPDSPGSRATGFRYQVDAHTVQGLPGTASIRERAGKNGAWVVTFTASWEQVFKHTHTWEVEVTPTGACTLLSESGNPFP